MPSYTISIKYGLLLTTQHYTAIGEVAATWQYLELAVQVAIWAVLGLDPEQGKLATASLRFDTHLEIIGIIALTVTQTEPDPINVSDLIQRTKDLQGQRNTVVHGLWTFGQPRAGEPVGDPMRLLEPEAWKLKFKDGKTPPQRFTPEQITAIAQRIYEAQLQWLGYASARRALHQKSALPNPPHSTSPG